MIQHFILTRSFYRQTDYNYLQYRFGLMRRFCGASLAAQTRQDFTWLIRFNIDASNATEVMQWAYELPIPVVFAPSAPLSGDDSRDIVATPDDFWRVHIRRRMLPGVTHILTTRMDDDDILAADFVERLRSQTQESELPIAYNFPVGYVVNLETSAGRRWRFPQNQFASVLSPVDPLILVNDIKHGDIEQLCPLKLVDEQPAFVWVRHPHTKSPGGRAHNDSIPIRRIAREFPVLR